MPTVELRHGDMFDGPSDLIVLPCSAGGTISLFVREKLDAYDIPFPKPRMEAGEVYILPFVGAENIAQYMAYAASVDSNRSSPKAIKQIGVQLGEFTKVGSAVRHISAPLLGAGAGGIKSELVVQALSEGFKETAHKDASLVISVIDKGEFDRIKDFIKALERDQPTRSRKHEVKPPRVFISYTHSTPQHMQWVEALGTFLRDNGVDARVDLWHLRHGMDLPQFMTNELLLADRVIIVSDKNYAEKADGRLGGAGWETMIVQGDMMQLPPDSVKYLVIVRSKDINSGLPRYLVSVRKPHFSELRYAKMTKIGQIW